MATRRPTITSASTASSASSNHAANSSSGGGGATGLAGLSHWRGESAFAAGGAGGFFPLIKDAAALHNEKEVRDEAGTRS